MFTLTVRVPRRTTGSVSLPVERRGAEVRQDGRTLWDGRRAARGVTYEGEWVTVAGLGAGTHTFTVRG